MSAETGSARRAFFKMARYRIKPFAALIDPPEWIEAGKVYEGEVDLFASTFAGKKVRLVSPDGQQSFTVFLRDLEEVF